MFETIAEMFSYGFIVRAFIVGTLVSLCAALLGVTLVLKRYSMIGDGLSHVGFGAFAIAASLNLAPFQVAVPVIIIAAFLLLRLSEKSKIRGDAAYCHYFKHSTCNRCCLCKYFGCEYRPQFLFVRQYSCHNKR
ncbi:MAG: metal ABC transporter permease [Ruminococcus sp.]